MPASGIERVSIGEKRFGSLVLDLIDHLPDKNRIDKAVAAAFAEVLFYRRKVVFLNQIIEAGTIE